MITNKNEAKAMTEHITNTSVTECDEIIIVMNNVSTKKDYSNKCIEYCFNKSSQYKSKRLLYFEHSFVASHITIDNYYYYLLLLCKKKV